MENEQTTAMVQRPASNGQMSAPIAGPPPENYVNGFEGMATAAFDPKIVAILRAPIPEQDVEIKPDGIVYLPGVFYRARLMDAFGPGGWSIAPRSPAKRAPASGGELVMYHGALWCHGRYVSEAVGQCVYYPNNAGMTYADAFEGAKTDCITRCCKDLGIAKELWDPTWRGQWQEKYAVKVKRRAQIWNPETRKKEWGEKEQWERKDRANKLGAAPATTGASAPPAATASGSSTAPVPSADTGEAPDDEALDQLEDLVFQKLAWKKKQAADWLRARFGTNDPSELTKMQVKTAFTLLFAFRLGDKEYTETLAALAAQGKCKP